MDTLTLVFAILAATLLAVTFYARRIGNEKRDVALLGAMGGLFGVSAVAAAII